MKKIDENKIIDVLKNCFDPEIPVDLWSLGLIYDISISNDNAVSITMTLTTPGCSMGNHMATDIKTKLEKINLINDAHVDITFDPEWKPEMMNDKAKTKLGFSANTSSNDTSWE